MVNTRKIAQGSRVEKGFREQRILTPEFDRQYKIKQLCDATVRLHRGFPSMSQVEVKKALEDCGLDMKKAASVLSLRQPIVVGDEVIVVAGLPVVNERRAPDFSKPHKDFVMIQVGRDPHDTYNIHKDVICHASPYFDSIFNSDGLFVPKDTLHTIVDFTSPGVFGLFQKWLYQKIIKDEQKRLPSTPQMVMLWVLGEKLQTPSLQNLAIKGLFGKSFANSKSGFDYIYKKTAEGSALRRLFVDQVMVRKMAPKGLADLLNNNLNNLPLKMLVDIILAQKRLLLDGGDSADELKVEDYLVAENRARE